MKKEGMFYLLIFFATFCSTPLYCEDSPYKQFAEIGSYDISAINDERCLFRNHVYKKKLKKQTEEQALQNQKSFKTPLTIYYPEKEGKCPFVVISHGFCNSKKTQASLAKYLASRGYISAIFTARHASWMQYFFDSIHAAFALVFAASKNTESVLFEKVDFSNSAVIGYSMGATAALQYAADYPFLKAVVALNPWGVSSKRLNTSGEGKRWVPMDLTGLTVPVMIVTGSNDAVAHPSKTFSFCKKMNTIIPLAFFSIKDGNHFHPIDTLQGMFDSEKHALYRALVFSWLELFLHNNSEPADQLYLDKKHLTVLSPYFKSFNHKAYPPFLLQNLAHINRMRADSSVVPANK